MPCGLILLEGRTRCFDLLCSVSCLDVFFFFLISQTLPLAGVLTCFQERFFKSQIDGRSLLPCLHLQFCFAYKRYLSAICERVFLLTKQLIAKTFRARRVRCSAQLRSSSLVFALLVFVAACLYKVGAWLYSTPACTALHQATRLHN